MRRRPKLWNDVFARVFVDLMRRYAGSPVYAAHMARDAADAALLESRESSD